jgi:hypothetical protein
MEEMKLTEKKGWKCAISLSKKWFSWNFGMKNKGNLFNENQTFDDSMAL